MDTARPFVSVVIPTYNRPHYLREALEAVLSQTLGDIEVLVLDNASPESPAALIERFGDPRVRLVRQQQNIGQFRNFLCGCRMAEGKYLALLGDDDRWQPEFLARLVRPLEEDDELVVAFCDQEVIDGAGKTDPLSTERITRRWRRHRLRPGKHRPFDRLAIIDRAVCIFSAAVLRREAIDWRHFPEDIELSFDLYLAYTAARTGLGCWYVPERLAAYRYHAQSMTSSVGAASGRIRNRRDAVRYWDRFVRDAAIAGCRRYCRMKRGFNALLLAQALFSDGRPAEAARELWAFARKGYLGPSILWWHLVYAIRLQRASA